MSEPKATVNRALTTKDVMAMTGLSERTIHRMKQCGELTCFKLRGRLRFQSCEVERWIEAHRVIPSIEPEPEQECDDLVAKWFGG